MVGLVGGAHRTGDVDFKDADWSFPQSFKSTAHAVGKRTGYVHERAERRAALHVNLTAYVYKGQWLLEGHAQRPPRKEERLRGVAKDCETARERESASNRAREVGGRQSLKRVKGVLVIVQIG